MDKLISAIAIRNTIVLTLFAITLIGCVPYPSPSVIPNESVKNHAERTEPVPTVTNTIMPFASLAIEEQVFDNHLPATQTPSEASARLHTPTPFLQAEIQQPPFIDIGNLDSPLVLLVGFGREIYLQDVTNGQIRMLDPDLRYFGEIPADFLGWRNNGCSFLLRTENFDIIEVDLQGNIHRKVFSYDDFDYPGEGTASIWVHPSPSEVWIAFQVGFGDRTEYDHGEGYHYDREELIVMSIDGLTGPYQLSSNGGAWDFSWSPDSTKLVFRDYDENKIFQVFVADLDGKNKQQLTHFLDLNMILRPSYHWSPTGEFIILARHAHYGWLYNIAILGIIDKQPFLYFENVNQYWWEDDNTLGIWQGSSILWINPINGDLIRQNHNVPDPKTYIYPFGSNKVFGCFFYDCFDRTDYGLVIYDIEEQRLTHMTNAQQIYDIEGWLAAPSTFKGEDLCQ
jgi:hypothetical protein